MMKRDIPLAGLMVSLSLWTAISATTTYHWEKTPERIPNGEEATFDFWLENFTQPLGDVMIDARFDSGSDSIFRVSHDSGSCTTTSLKESDQVHSTVSLITCDHDKAKYSFRIKKCAVNLRFYVHAHKQRPNHSRYNFVYPYSRYYYVYPYKAPNSADITVKKSIFKDMVFVGESVEFKCYFRDGENSRAYFTLHRLNTTRPIPQEATVTPEVPIPDRKQDNYGENVSITWHAARGNEGWYQCKAIYDPKSVGEFTSTPVYLNVVYAPVIDDSKDHSDHLEAEIGVNVTFSIPILANPVASAVWTRQGKLLQNNRFQVDVETDEDGQEFVLSFAVQDQDYGTYKCIVSNTQGQSTYYFNLEKPQEPVAEHSQWNATSTALLVVITPLVLILAAIGIAFSVIFHRRNKRPEPPVACNRKTAEEPVYEDMSGGHM